VSAKTSEASVRGEAPAALLLEGVLNPINQLAPNSLFSTSSPDARKASMKPATSLSLN